MLSSRSVLLVTPNQAAVGPCLAMFGCRQAGLEAGAQKEEKEGAATSVSRSTGELCLLSNVAVHARVTAGWCPMLALAIATRTRVAALAGGVMDR